MTIPLEEQLTAILTPVFGTEIYPLVHPDPDGTMGSVADLYAVYTMIPGQSFNTLEGDTCLSRVRVQVSIYSIDYTQLKVKQKAASQAMKAANVLASSYVGTATDHFEISGALTNLSVNTPSEGFEEDTRRFSTILEFYCWSRGE